MPQRGVWEWTQQRRLAVGGMPQPPTVSTPLPQQLVNDSLALRSVSGAAVDSLW